MDILKSIEFRKQCVEDMKKRNYQNRNNFFERYLAGEDFTRDDLETLGYTYFGARNIHAYITHEHNDDYYSRALGWE